MPKSIRAVADRSEQRGETRQAPEINQASVLWRGRELEVSVCDVSGGGVMIETLDLRPTIGETVQLRIAGCRPIRCTICWLKGCRIGLRFAHETSIDGPGEVQDFILRKLRGETQAPPNRTHVARPRRYRLIWQATLCHQGDRRTARIRNISPEGAMIECDRSFDVGTELMLDLAEAGTISAQVRWCQGGQIGLRFSNRFDLRVLAACKPVAARTVPVHRPPTPTGEPRRTGLRRKAKLRVGRIAGLFRHSRQR